MRQQTAHDDSVRRPRGAGAGVAAAAERDASHPDEAAAPAVAEFITALEKALRARRLYQPNNPVCMGFVAALNDACLRLWHESHSVTLAVDEHGFRWGQRTFTAGEGRESLAFLFYRDGVRFITFLPGFEEEIEPFLTVLNRARALDQRSDDDIVTLLWQASFISFQYTYIDVLADGVVIPEGNPPPVSPRRLAEEPGAAVSSGSVPVLPHAMAQGQGAVAQTVSRAAFAETLYFLDHGELRQLQHEVQLELDRNVRTDVLNALFDRLEEPGSDRQREILGILRQLLPTFLSGGDIAHATRLLTELSAILQQVSLAESEQAAAEAIYAELSDPSVLSQLLAGMENGSIDPDSADLGLFLEHLGPGALPPLLRTMVTTPSPTLQHRLRVAIQRLARRHGGELAALLRSDSPEVVRGAARLVAQLGLVEAVPNLIQLLANAPLELRRMAVEGLMQIQHSSALEGLRMALRDHDRDIRISAARGLAAARYAPARPTLEELIRSRAVRSADLTERIAFFEAFGAVALPESVAYLDRLLNGRRFFRRHSPELRACAALALGRMSAPTARAALQKAARDSQAMVRSAAAKALRGEASS